MSWKTVLQGWNKPTTGPIFPRWADKLVLLLILGAPAIPLYVGVLIAYGASPKTTDVGYAPKQPIPYSHALHAGQLGIDCRYCHTSVETSAKANIPSSQTCNNCHSRILTESPKLQPLRESIETGNPIPWVRVHDLPDYAYFDHSAHVTRGVGCVTCHDRVDTMDVVYQAKPLSMSWCVDCHRNPEDHLRPPKLATDMLWTQTTLGADGKTFDLAEFKKTNSINPPTDCSTCHR